MNEIFFFYNNYYFFSFSTTTLLLLSLVSIKITFFEEMPSSEARRLDAVRPRSSSDCPCGLQKKHS